MTESNTTLKDVRRADLSAEWRLHHLHFALFAAWQGVHDGFIARRDAARFMTTTLLDGITAR